MTLLGRETRHNRSRLISGGMCECAINLPGGQILKTEETCRRTFWKIQRVGLELGGHQTPKEMRHPQTSTSRPIAQWDSHGI